jgi:hypothetical protein
MYQAPMDLTLSAFRLRRPLFATIGVLASAGLVAELLQHRLKLKRGHPAVSLFSLSYEGNIPTWFSSALLLSCALLLAVIASGTRRGGGPYVRHWWVLTGAFVYISLDETSSIHEGANWLDLSGVLYFSWVVPASVAVALLGLYFLRFLVHLPRRARLQFIISGAIYVGGALVMELPLGFWTEREGSHNLVYGLIDLVEETMEMVGAGLFLLSLVEYAGARGYGFRLATPSAEP